MTLEDLRETIPQEPERDPAEREDPEDQAYFADQAARIREAERLKNSISEQIKGGNAPEIILLSAVQAIGLLTADQAWAAEQTARLDTSYNPAIDAAFLAAAEAEARRQEYAAAVRKRLVTARNKTTALLDAVNAAIDCFWTKEGYFRDALDVIKDIRQLPHAQPKIIRCKDCKHYYYADNRIPQEQKYVCDLDSDRWNPDDYCSYAERKTDETD